MFGSLCIDIMLLGEVCGLAAKPILATIIASVNATEQRKLKTLS